MRANGSRFDTPIGSSLGTDTLLGTAFTDQNLNREHARQQRWRVSVQRELASNLGLEVAYNGSYSDQIDRNIRAGLPAGGVPGTAATSGIRRPTRS